MRFDRKKHTKTVENGITLHQWDIGLVFRKHLVMPGFSIAWMERSDKTPAYWAGPGFTKRNDESTS